MIIIPIVKNKQIDIQYKIKKDKNNRVIIIIILVNEKK